MIASMEKTYLTRPKYVSSSTSPYNRSSVKLIHSNKNYPIIRSVDETFVPLSFSSPRLRASDAGRVQKLTSSNQLASSRFSSVACVPWENLSSVEIFSMKSPGFLAQKFVWYSVKTPSNAVYSYQRSLSQYEASHRWYRTEL